MIAESTAELSTPDEALVASYRAGSQVAFAQLYDRYNARITTYALRLLSRREEAEDVCTETFVRVVDGRWKPTGNVRSYLFTVAHRMCLDRLRRRQRTARVLSLFGRRGSAAATPEDAVVLGERDHGLQRAVDALPAPHRAAVLLTYNEDLTAPEVAQITGDTPQQVRSKLSYARRRLRATLEDPHEP